MKNAKTIWLHKYLRSHSCLLMKWFVHDFVPAEAWKGMTFYYEIEFVNYAQILCGIDSFLIM